MYALPLQITYSINSSPYFSHAVINISIRSVTTSYILALAGRTSINLSYCSSVSEMVIRLHAMIGLLVGNIWNMNNLTAKATTCYNYVTIWFIIFDCF